MPEDLNTRLWEDSLQQFFSQENFQSAMENYINSMEDLKYISDLSDVTGGLSSADQAFIDSIRENATQNLIESVNEATIDLANKEISRLVDRGVLQGGVGEETLSRIYEKAGKTVMQGTRDIETALANASLNLLQKNKDRQLQAISTIGSLGEDWNKALLSSLASMKESEARNALTSELANREERAYKQAQTLGLLGNIGSSLIHVYPFLRSSGGSGSLSGLAGVGAAAKAGVSGIGGMTSATPFMGGAEASISAGEAASGGISGFSGMAGPLAGLGIGAIGLAMLNAMQESPTAPGAENYLDAWVKNKQQVGQWTDPGHGGPGWQELLAQADTSTGTNPYKGVKSHLYDWLRMSIYGPTNQHGYVPQELVDAYYNRDPESLLGQDDVQSWMIKNYRNKYYQGFEDYTAGG